MIGPGPSASGGGGGPRDDDRTPLMGSQLALRVAVVGSIALLLFAVIFLRLWFLQVLTGNQAVATARGNITRKVPVAAPRGSILASDGSTLLVDSVKVPAILIAPQQLPAPLLATPKGLIHQPAKDYPVYTRLERALGMSTKATSCTFSIEYANQADKLVAGTYSPRLQEVPCIIAQHAADITNGSVTIITNVPQAEQAYISERQLAFPGVEVSQVSVSQYPQGTLAAQLLGTVGANSSSATGKQLFKGVPKYDNVGQDGLEYEYNKYLQGKDGAQQIEVNAEGTYEGQAKPIASTIGDNLKTSINLPLEKVGDAALAESLQNSGSPYGGAFIAMDPQSGQVYAMGSLPSYNPQVFDKPLSQEQYDAEFGNSVTAPLLNRATQGVGLPGSTFKVITATAALQSGAWTPDQTYDDSTGSLTVSGESFANAPGDGALGVLDMPKAIQYSDDVFFYHLGYLMDPDPATQPQGAALQQWARSYGINQRPDIDLPGASRGTIPDPAQINQEIREEHECDTATGEYAYTNGQGAISSKKLKGFHRSPTHLDGGCGIADASTVGWTIGDNMQAAIGQDGVSASPLQMAMVYSAIENGGTLVSPHIGEDIQTASGQVVAKINPGPERKLDIRPANLAVIQQGLEQAANAPGGTSYDVMSGFGKTVYGKTGTADYKPSTGPDAGIDQAYAWYDCYVPSTETSKPIEVTVWVEAGGYGDETAAPVARELLSQWFYGTSGGYHHGSSASH
jgi:penicillin-binding protein 2